MSISKHILSPLSLQALISMRLVSGKYGLKWIKKVSPLLKLDKIVDLSLRLKSAHTDTKKSMRYIAPQVYLGVVYADSFKAFFFIFW